MMLKEKRHTFYKSRDTVLQRNKKRRQNVGIVDLQSWYREQRRRRIDSLWKNNINPKIYVSLSGRIMGFSRKPKKTEERLVTKRTASIKRHKPPVNPKLMQSVSQSGTISE
ncbi:hypothetical protein YC2023_085854 [Brassica napus]